MLHLLQTDNAAGELATEVGIETRLHEEATGKGLAVEVMFTLGATELVELVASIGVEAGHVPARCLQTYVMLKLVAEEDGLALVLGDKHLATEALVLVG